MRKPKATILILLMSVSMLLGSCRTVSADLDCRVVTGITVTFENGPFHVKRHYTTSEKMQKILNYLRVIDPYGAPDENPETTIGSMFQIVLTYSDGCEKTYLQKSDRFMMVQGQDWKKIDPSRARELSEILGKMNSDLPL